MLASVTSALNLHRINPSHLNELSVESAAAAEKTTVYFSAVSAISAF